MELHEFLEMMERRETVSAGSAAHELMHRVAPNTIVGGIPAKLIKQIPQE